MFKRIMKIKPVIFVVCFMFSFTLGSIFNTFSVEDEDEDVKIIIIKTKTLHSLAPPLMYDHQEFYTICSFVRSAKTALDSQLELLTYTNDTKQRTKLKSLNKRLKSVIELSTVEYNTKAARLDDVSLLKNDRLPVTLETTGDTNCLVNYEL